MALAPGKWASEKPHDTLNLAFHTGMIIEQCRSIEKGLPALGIPAQDLVAVIRSMEQTSVVLK